MKSNKSQATGSNLNANLSKHQKLKYQNSEVLNRIAIEDVDKQYASIGAYHHKHGKSNGD